MHHYAIDNKAADNWHGIVNHNAIWYWWKHQVFENIIGIDVKCAWIYWTYLQYMLFNIIIIITYISIIMK